MNYQVYPRRTTIYRLVWSCMLGMALLWLLLMPRPAAAKNIIHVTPAGDGTGTSWNDATDLQSALGSANSGDEIWVAQGVYLPGNTQASTFTLKSGVALYGGFVGMETARSQRNWETNPTVLSGDLAGDDATDADGVVTDPDDINGTNAYHVVTGSGVDATAVLDGFFVTAGSTASNGGFPCSLDCGAGMFNDNGSPTLTNLTFSGNAAYDSGGGMYNTNASNPQLTNVTFSANSAMSGYGGGMTNREDSSPTLTNVSFRGNSATGGGGMYNREDSSPTLTNVTFSANSARFC